MCDPIVSLFPFVRQLMTTGSTKFMWLFFDLCLLHLATALLLCLVPRITLCYHRWWTYTIWTLFFRLKQQEEVPRQVRSNSAMEAEEEELEMFTNSLTVWSHFCAFQFIPKNKSTSNNWNLRIWRYRTDNSEAKTHKRPSIGILGALKTMKIFTAHFAVEEFATQANFSGGRIIGREKSNKVLSR